MKANDYPLVSVIISGFNGEKYLEHAIQSVLSQTYQNLEIIFWDNQSTDNSKKIVHSFMDDRIKYFYAPTFTKLYAARNQAIEKSKGEYIAFLDCDDWWDQSKIEKQIAKFMNSNFSIVYNNMRLVYVKETRFGNQINKLISNFLSRDHIKKDDQVREGEILNTIIKEYKVGMPTIMIKKSDFKGFDNRYQVIGDFDYIIRASAESLIGYIDESLAYYRIHGLNDSFKNRKLQIEELKNWFKEMQDHKILSRLTEFQKFKYKIMYTKVMDDIGDRNFSYPIKCLYDLPSSMWLTKLRILSAILMPSIVIKIFRT